MMHVSIYRFLQTQSRQSVMSLAAAALPRRNFSPISGTYAVSQAAVSGEHKRILYVLF